MIISVDNKREKEKKNMKNVPSLELLLLPPLLLLLHLVVVGLVVGLVVNTSKLVWWSLNASWCWDLGREYMAVECRQCFLNSNEHVQRDAMGSSDWCTWNIFRVGQNIVTFPGKTVENARYRDLNSDIPVCLSTDTPPKVMCLHRRTGYRSKYRSGNGYFHLCIMFVYIREKIYG